jgi:hypothetical protein
MTRDKENGGDKRVGALSPPFSLLSVAWPAALACRFAELEVNHFGGPSNLSHDGFGSFGGFVDLGSDFLCRPTADLPHGEEIEGNERVATVPTPLARRFTIAIRKCQCSYPPPIVI